jgi:hypothetical protein
LIFGCKDKEKPLTSNEKPDKITQKDGKCANAQLKRRENWRGLYFFEKSEKNFLFSDSLQIRPITLHQKISENHFSEYNK